MATMLANRFCSSLIWKRRGEALLQIISSPCAAVWRIIPPSFVMRRFGTPTPVRSSTTSIVKGVGVKNELAN